MERMTQFRAHLLLLLFVALLGFYAFNLYDKQVYETVSPYLAPKEKTWLRQVTKAIKRTA